jgi:hypothetical protein
MSPRRLACANLQERQVYHIKTQNPCQGIFPLFNIFLKSPSSHIILCDVELSMVQVHHRQNHYETFDVFPLAGA